jgi:hypothetical protein
MSNQTLLGEDELAFEQLLLGAGLAEALPHERTEAALLRFAASAAALQSTAIGAGAVGGPAAGAVVRSWARLVEAGKWLALGAVAGGVATFVWLRQPAPPNAVPSAPVAVVARPVAPVQAALASTSQPVKVSEPPPATTAVETIRSTRISGTGTATRGTVKPTSDLAAEVMALDGIRTALSIGALRDAELKLANYRRTFARGSLRSEAEVLALEVLVAQGRTEAANRAAERFIGQHPRDPQVARVRALVE